MIREVDYNNSKIIIGDKDHDGEVRISTINPNGVGTGVYVNQKLAELIIEHLREQFNLTK